MEKYFVVSNGDEPLKIFFALEPAKEYGGLGDYIDSFDEAGNKVDGWKAISAEDFPTEDGEHGETVWTQEF